MAIQTLNTIKTWFKTGLKPSQTQFWDTWDSFRHKYEKVPLKDIEELETALGAKAEKSQLNEHTTNEYAHAELFLEKEDIVNKGIANGYVPLDEFAKITAQYLNIVNDLITGGESSLLSAQQGVALQNQIDSINILLASDNIDLDTIQKIADAIKLIQISLDTILVNDLTTGGVTKALTAEMGKLLHTSKENKSQKGVAGGYAPLDEFSKITHQYLTIVNNLTTGGATSMLSAEQGVVLQNQIDGICTLLYSDDVNLDTIQEIADAIKNVESNLATILVNDLTTGGVTKALTAEMGKLLNEIKLTATIATDAETQILAPVAEDLKVISRSKLFNWWTWIKLQVNIWTGKQTFSVAPRFSSTTTNQFLKTDNNKDLISISEVTDLEMQQGTDNLKPATALRISNWFNFQLNQPFTLGSLTGLGVRLVQVNSTGDLSANYQIQDGFITDTDIISAITTASYNAENNFTASINPINSKVFSQGQWYKNLGVLYFASDDNQVSRITLS